MTLTEFLTRMRALFAEALFVAPAPGTEEQANDALQAVTRWAWLPPLSGTAIAADRAVTTPGNGAGNSREQAEKTQ